MTYVHAARPRDWTLLGYDPSVIIDDVLETELKTTESVASGIGIGLQANNRRLNDMGRMLRWAGWMLITAPFAGAATYVAIRSIN